MTLQIAIVVVIGVALLLDFTFQVINAVRYKDGLVLGFYRDVTAPRHGSLRGQAFGGKSTPAPASIGAWVVAWLRTPIGFFATLASAISVFLAPTAYLLALGHNSGDRLWGIVGLCCLGLLYLLTGFRASATSGAARAGLIAGALLAVVASALMTATPLPTGDTWDLGPWSSAKPSLIGYLAYFVSLLGVLGLPGVALSAGSAIAGKTWWQRRETAMLSMKRGRRGRRR